MPATQAPVDTDVKLPPGVAAQAAAADEAHKRAYPKQDAPQPTLAPPPTDQPAPQPAPPPAPPQASMTSPQPVPPQEPQPTADENLTAEQWRHRYLSMKGRYEQSATAIGSMQEQMAELGDELVRTQQSIRQPQPEPQRQQAPPQSLVTDEEIKTYGPELIDLVQRAARAAIMPDLRNLHNGVDQVNKRVQGVSANTLYQNLDRHVPTWREINVNPRFKVWCSLRDVYSGALRGKLLNAAFQAADAPRVVAFFNGFLAEEQATGQLPDPSLQPPSPAPRTAAIPLDMLTAPGRAHPAGGDNPNLPVDKPIFTRAQIAAFYADIRRGSYVGRDPEKQQMEQSIFLAQREGRVR